MFLSELLSYGLQLEGQSKLSDEERKRVQDLAYAWDLPPLTENNRRWLFEKLLLHSVSELKSK